MKIRQAYQSQAVLEMVGKKLARSKIARAKFYNKGEYETVKERTSTNI